MNRDTEYRELETHAQDCARSLEEIGNSAEAERRRFYEVLETLPAYLILLTPDYHVSFANRFFRERFGESKGRRCYEYLFGRCEPCENCQSFVPLKTKAPHRWEWNGPDGRIYDIYDYPFTDSDGSPMVMEMGIDITEWRKAEQALKEANEGLEQRVAERTSELASSEEKYRTLFANMSEAFALHEMIFSESGKPVDYRFIEVNEAFERQTGLKREDVNGRTVLEILPDTEPYWIEIYGKVVSSGEPVKLENYSRALDRWYEVYAFRPTPGRFAVLFMDITERKNAEDSLQGAYERERHIGQELQKAIVPPTPTIGDGYQVASAYIPAFAGEEVGGDFYDIFRLSDGRVGLLIGDVSGKGVHAAAHAASTRSAIRAISYGSSSASQVLSRMNDLLCLQEDGSTFITAFLAVLDTDTGSLHYSSAGHPAPSVLRADGNVEFLSVGGCPLGIIPGQEYGEGEAYLGPRDGIVLYTDGIVESRHRGELFGLDGIKMLLSQHGGDDVGSICASLLNTAREWAQGMLKDDTALVVIQREKTSCS